LILKKRCGAVFSHGRFVPVFSSFFAQTTLL